MFSEGMVNVGDEMEELRLGAAASVDRGMDPAKWCKIHIYIPI